MLCDFCYASTNARFALTETSLGIMPGAGGTQRLVRSLGKQVAALMLLSGEQITGARAFQLGLVAELAEPGQALARAMELATSMSTLAPLTLKATKT